MIPSHRWSVGALLIAALLPLPCTAQDDAARPAPAQAAEGSASSIAWTLPAGWSAAAIKPMRIAMFTVAGDQGAGECGLFLFPGGGDRLANVNRWRGQAGLAPLDAATLDRELTTGTCTFGPFAWLPVRGPGKAFLAAMLPTPGGQCFVKLEAPADRLDGLRDGFLAFCRSLRPASPH